MSKDNVVLFNGVTLLKLPPDLVLEKAKGCIGEGVVIIGYDTGGELYFASSIPDGPNALWLLELAKKALLEIEVEV